MKSFEEVTKIIQEQETERNKLIKETDQYKITWFNSKRHKVECKFFTTYEAAYNWAKKTLDNYTREGIIQSIN